MIVEKKDYEHFVLSNGIRIIHKFDDSNVARCGIIINAGSRDEEENEHGLAHFIEHVLFKGTTKRKSYHIIARLEDVGGDLNAYTTKEETAIYATFLTEYYERSVELISDILFNSTFPETELKKEKEVIIEEINSYKDNPAEMIFDDFDELMYSNHPIGRNILGTVKSVKGFSRNNINRFIQKNYLSHEMVFCSVGNIEFDKLVALCSKYLNSIQTSPIIQKRTSFENYLPFNIVREKKTHQAHCIIGTLAYDYKNDKRIILMLLNNILGGNNMNSRLNLSLREKYGLAYNIESSYMPFTDTGIFSIYFGTDKTNIPRCTDLIIKELVKLKNEPLGVVQLQKAKKQMIGQVAIASENKEGLLFTYGKSFMLYNKVDSLEDVNAKIERITVEQLHQVANEIFDENKLSFLVYK